MDSALDRDCEHKMNQGKPKDLDENSSEKIRIFAELIVDRLIQDFQLGIDRTRGGGHEQSD